MSLPTVQVDIVSDVVCPWCYVGFRQLEQALGQTGLGAILRWHPFELNPGMAAEGQNLREHLMEKYGISVEQSQAARARLGAVGKDVGIDFRYSDDMRMVNTFAAHQLLDWAFEQNLQHPLKLALFHAYFTEGRDVSDIDVLADVAQSVGLDPAEARRIVESGTRAAETREKLNTWIENGITGVPAMIFGGKYLVTGAQGVENYVKVLQRCAAEAA